MKSGGGRTWWRLASRIWPALVILCCTVPASAITNDDCLECHRDQTLSMEGPDGKPVSLYVGAASFGSSVHAGLGCTDCHADIKDLPHPEKLARVQCGTCHADEQAEYATSTHGKAQAEGNQDAPDCSDCHGTHDILSPSDANSRVSPINLVGTCARCHANPEVTKKYSFADRAPVSAYVQSVHGKALLENGNIHAANCATCHTAHHVLPASDPASSVNKKNLPHTCAKCHDDIYQIYKTSVHGVAVEAGNNDAPSCADCHGEHQIQAPTDPRSSVFPANIAKTTCTRCHASTLLSQRYGMQTNRVSSYQETYHGLASARGDLAVANCASCHGVHNIYPPADPRSTVNKANLVKTCGNCHPNVTERFANIAVHPQLNAKGFYQQPLADKVAWVYVIVIVGVIGGMAAHNGLIWWYYVLEKYRRERGKAKIRRFTRLEAVEHQLNFVCFFVLVFTGFALKFPNAGWVHLTERLGMTEYLRGLTHRVAAVMMITVAVMHLCYLLFTRRGRRDLLSLMPRATDVRDFVYNMAFHLRLRSQRPYFPRFDYTEKAEYLALIWGTTVMIVSGLILWFPTIASKHLPPWGYSVAVVVHYYEAWLAFLAILVWHFFFVFFHPESYPVNLTFLDGKTTEEHALHHHGKLEDD